MEVDEVLCMMTCSVRTWVSAESGALPVNRKFILPPVTAFSLLNRSLERDISLTSSN